MQVNHGPWSPLANMRVAVSMLKDLYSKFGSEKAAVLAYNVGPSNYAKKRFHIKYWNSYAKFKQTLILRSDHSGYRYGSWDDGLELSDNSGRRVLYGNRETCKAGEVLRGGNSGDQQEQSAEDL